MRWFGILSVGYNFVDIFSALGFVQGYFWALLGYIFLKIGEKRKGQMRVKAKCGFCHHGHGFWLCSIGIFAEIKWDRKRSMRSWGEVAYIRVIPMEAIDEI